MATILSYTYEADDHCVPCTLQRYQSGGFDKAEPDDPMYISDGVDQHRVGYDALDYEGNYLHPRFSYDEWQEFDPGYIAEHPIQYLACGDCRTVIATWKEESDV